MDSTHKQEQMMLRKNLHSIREKRFKQLEYEFDSELNYESASVKPIFLSIQSELVVY